MCEHNTTIVKYDQGNVQVEVCTWGCGQTIISVKRADAVTESFTAAELSVLRARVGAAESQVSKLIGLALCFNEDDPWIFERYEGVEIVANAQAFLKPEA